MEDIMTKQISEDDINRAVADATQAAVCAMAARIQSACGHTSGDFAGQYFDGQKLDALVAALRVLAAAYAPLEAELGE